MPRTAKKQTVSEPSLEQILAVTNRLDAAARTKVAQALVEREVDARFERLIQNLAAKLPTGDILDAEIQAEVDTVRRTRLQASC